MEIYVPWQVYLKIHQKNVLFQSYIGSNVWWHALLMFTGELHFFSRLN